MLREGTIATAHDAIANLPASDACAQRGHFARRLETCWSSLRRRVQAVARNELAAIERCGTDANTHLPWLGLRNGYVAQLERHCIVCGADPP